jgi:hypothetical protein
VSSGTHHEALWKREVGTERDACSVQYCVHWYGARDLTVVAQLPVGGIDAPTLCRSDSVELTGVIARCRNFCGITDVLDAHWDGTILSTGIAEFARGIAAPAG